MRRLGSALREHWVFVAVVATLIVVTTFPTIVYLFRTDVFWLPTGGSKDVFIKIWDIWYGRQFLTGAANPYFTDLMFYPEGVALTQNFFIPHIVFVQLLQLILPLSNAYSLTYLLMIFVCALSAYIYLLYLFNEKWLAMFGAVVFGLSPHVVSHPNHPEIAFVATLPATLYCLQRGITENRRAFMLGAGVLAGLTTVISLYLFVCLMLSAGFLLAALALRRWRRRDFWRLLALFLVVTGIASAWRIAPILADTGSIGEIAAWHDGSEGGSDLVSFFTNHYHPLLGPLGQSILETPPQARISGTSYLGYAVLALAAAALFSKSTRRRTLPWALLAGGFMLLRLGSILAINGEYYISILLPQYYLDQFFPFIFAPFHSSDHYMMGVILPLAIVASYGLLALRQRFLWARKPAFTLLLIALVAFEYHIPVEDGHIPQERFAYLEWLADEAEPVSALVNLPMGRSNAKRYNLFQALSGYPQTEGAISRTPDSAYTYIRGNYLLNAWQERQAVACEDSNRQQYLEGLGQLEDDGFSHVVFHRDFYYVLELAPSFHEASAAYNDDFVSIYRLQALRESCPQA